MMLGASSVPHVANSADTSAALPAEAEPRSLELGGAGGTAAAAGGGGEEEKTRFEELHDRSSAGNRWPRQETLALLQIRHDMDVAFRDSSLKGPLWEKVSRKMADLGYHRSAKKCKEKFENVYKYHKRTKDGRASKADGKTYRFFDQLQAFDQQLELALPTPPPRSQPQTVVPTPMPGNTAVDNESINQSRHVAVHSTPISISNIPMINASTLPPPQPPPPTQSTNPQIFGGAFLDSSTSSTSSDEAIARRDKRKRKRKWKDFFERLMRNVIDKQEELQKNFMETLENRDRERMMREEAWRVQEMARMNRERDLLAQERSMAAAKDAALVSFLQQLSHQQNAQNAAPQVQLPQILVSPWPPQQPPPPQPPSTALVVTPAPPPASKSGETMAIVASKNDNGGGDPSNYNNMSVSPSRWPKAEVQALIQLRTGLDPKYLESGPKGPLWEEISAAMRRLGYNRNAKRCKEKWENINKYFKKVKESNKKRPEDSKTCPYFHQLEALYKEKAKHESSFGSISGYQSRPETAISPIMARPEQQWPLQQHHRPDLNPAGHDDHGDDDEDEEDDIDLEDDDDNDEDGGGFEIVTNKPPPSTAGMATTTVEQ